MGDRPCALGRKVVLIIVLITIGSEGFLLCLQ